ARFVGVRSAWPQGGAANSRLRRWGAARATAPGARGRGRRFTRRTGAARERRQMSDLLPDTERILMGPGPSLTSPRVMRAMAGPTVSPLDPGMIALLDDTRLRLARLFRAAEGSLALAVSGTGTAAMETTVANLVQEGTRALVIVTGYFGDRLAQMCE